MRKIKYLFLPVVLFAMLFTSCKKDLVTPPAPVDGLTAFPGRNRAMVEFNAPAGAVKGKVFFNNGEYKEFAITEPDQQIVIEGLKEQEQALRVITLNAAGEKSDPKAVKVTVYGDSYEQGLKPRKWKDQTISSSGDVQLIFDTARAGETAVRVVYVTNSGTMDSTEMPASEKSVVIKNIDTQKDYFYYSIYKPVSNSIDSFYSAKLSVKEAMMMDFQKEKWVIEASSSQDGVFGASNLIDNNSNTSWHTAQGTTFAQWVTIDMGNSKVVDGFYYVKTPESSTSGNGPKDLKIEMSSDNIQWTTVLQTVVKESYLRQQLPLVQSVKGRYFRLSVTSTVNPGATQAAIAEIDAYNSLNQSGINGYLPGAPIALENAKAPFTGDGSDLLPAVGAYRMQKVLGWKHNANANISYDNSTKVMNPFSAAIWGAPAVVNGKIFQTVNLEPGHYLLQIESGVAEGPAEIYGVGASGSTLPDFTKVSTSSATIQYANLMNYQNTTVEMLLTITKESSVSIGVVFNLPDRYPTTGVPWTHFTLKGFDLQKLD